MNRSFVFFRIGKTGYLITPKSSIVLFVINGILGPGLGLTVTSVTACGALGDGISTPQCSLMRILPSGLGYWKDLVFSWQDAEFSISKFLSKIVIFRTEIWYIEWLIGSYPIPGCTIH